MLHEIYPHVLDISWPDGRDRTEGRAVCIRDGSVLIFRKDGETFLPCTEELPYEAREKKIFLFIIDSEAYFLVKDADEFGDYRYEPAQTARSASPLYTAFAVSLAVRLSAWYDQNVYCGACGTAMVHSTTERAVVCPKCVNTVYPRIDPAVIVAVTDGDRLLVTKYPGGRSYALVAGYIESGETPEDAVRREVMEEAGIRVKDIRYYKSQPWPFSGSLLLGFVCVLDGDDKITVDTGELEDARWLERADIPDRSNDISLTAEMMELFRSGKGKDL